MGNNKNFPNGWNNFWIKVGIGGAATYKLYRTYDEYMRSLPQNLSDKARTVPTFVPAPSQRN
jgi:hypothetical protein